MCTTIRGRYRQNLTFPQQQTRLPQASPSLSRLCRWLHVKPPGSQMFLLFANEISFRASISIPDYVCPRKLDQTTWIFFFFPSANKLENNTVPPFWNIACTGLFRPVLKRRKNSRWQKRITCTDSSFLGERVCFLKKKNLLFPRPPPPPFLGGDGGGGSSLFFSLTQYALVVCVCVCDFVVFDGAGSGGDDGIGVGDDV